MAASLPDTATVCLLFRTSHTLPDIIIPSVQKNYVQTIRAMEAVLGIGGPALDLHLDIDLKLSLSNVTAAISTTVQASRLLNLEVKAALLASVPILLELSQKLKFKLNFTPATSKQKEPLVAK